MTAIRKAGRPPPKVKKESEKSYDRLTKTTKRMPTKRVFVCSPLAGNTERNIKRAVAYSRFVFDEGYVPWTPHIYYTAFLNEDDADERAAGIRYGMDRLWECSELWVFGENITRGMRAEIDLAEDLKIRVRYFDGDCVEITR